MNPEINPSPETPAAPAGLQAELKALVKLLKTVRARKRREGLYRRFVVTGLTSGLSATEYQQQLLAAGLKPGRASDFARILKQPAAAAQFTQGDPPLSFAKALRLARGQTRPAPPRKSPFEQLSAKAEALLATQSATQPWTRDCGMFRLRFEPGPSGAPETPPPANLAFFAPPLADPDPPETVVIPLGPQTYQQLDCLAHQSGLNCQETARLLLQRVDWPKLLSLIPPPQPPAHPSPPAEKKFSGARRKNPARNREDVHRVAVKMPAEPAAHLETLGRGCGLSRSEMAVHLLEPQAAGRIATLRLALEDVWRQRSPE